MGLLRALRENSTISQVVELSYLLPYLLIIAPWSSVLLEKLTGSQLVKKFSHFMEPKHSLPHLQVTAVRTYSEP